MNTERPQWSESFDLEILPGEMREPFAEFLAQRNAVRAYYLAIPEERFNECIVEGSDSPRRELIHQIEHTYARVEALKTGELPSYNYRELFSELARLDNLEKDELIQGFEQVTQALFLRYTQPTILDKQIKLPYRAPVSSLDLLGKIKDHEILHLGMLVKMGDYFSVGRPDEMRAVWG